MSGRADQPGPMNRLCSRARACKSVVAVPQTKTSNAVLLAVQNSQHSTKDQLGMEPRQLEKDWLPVYEALRDWWPKRFDLDTFAPYLQALDDQPPTAAMAAVRSLRAEPWRPVPSEVYRAIMGAADRQQADQPKGQKLRKDQQPATLERVLWLLDVGGERVCDCPTRAVTVHKDEHHVLRCTRCRGVEQGQAFQAEDYGAA